MKATHASFSLGTSDSRAHSFAWID